MARLGTVTLQSTDDSDVFFSEGVYLNGITDNDEAETELCEPGFDEDLEYISGRVPRMHTAEIEGDTRLLFGWFKGERFSASYYLCIYIEYEEVEEIDQSHE